MAAVIDPWTGPGSGTADAPNTYWWFSFAASQTVSTRVQFFNAVGGLVTVNATLAVVNVGTGALLSSATFSGVNTINLGPLTMGSGQTYKHRITYNGGTSCHHCVVTVTSMGASTTGHTLFNVRRLAAWSGAPGHQVFERRGGGWVILTGGLGGRRSAGWKAP